MTIRVPGYPYYEPKAEAEESRKKLESEIKTPRRQRHAK
jgi:hypothetical protein